MRVLGVLTAAAALAAAAPSSASSARTELSVPRATVELTATGLTGSFVVRNTGRAVGRTSATLGVRAGSRRILVARFTVPALGRGASRRVVVRGKLPAGLPVGRRTVTACADSGHRIRERSETNNCRRVLTLSVGRSSASPSAATTVAPAAPTSGPAGPPPMSATASTIPADPVPFQKQTAFRIDGPSGPYWTYVPASYDESHTTPTTLLIWLHGCSERSSERILDASPGGGQSWITIAPGGRDGGCWQPNEDVPAVLAAIADVKRHFNIAARHVVIGGYSSGGDLAYRTAYENANLFAGLLAEGSSPFQDTGCASPGACTGSAAWRFNVVHVAHTSDEYYAIETVRRETDALREAGFPVTRIERPGTHYAADSADSGTVYDLRTYLLPHLDDPWLAPAG